MIWQRRAERKSGGSCGSDTPEFSVMHHGRHLHVIQQFPIVPILGTW